jgi:signal peptidase I
MLFNRSSGSPRLAHRVLGTSMGSVVLFFIEILQIMLIAAAIIVPIRFFLIKPFIVRGASMEPNFHNSEYLIIDEISYRVGPIQRGQVVVFTPPNDTTGEYYIKRVIGLPGETIEIEDGRITIYNSIYPNGAQLKEDYIEDYTHGRVKVTLELDEYYVLGDNREESLDSRRFGPVERGAIVGKVLLRGLPLDKFGTITAPEYLF